jgi:hypothetical protein
MTESFLLAGRSKDAPSDYPTKTALYRQRYFARRAAAMVYLGPWQSVLPNAKAFR